MIHQCTICGGTIQSDGACDCGVEPLMPRSQSAQPGGGETPPEMRCTDTRLVAAAVRASSAVGGLLSGDPMDEDDALAHLAAALALAIEATDPAACDPAAAALHAACGRYLDEDGPDAKIPNMAP